MDNINQNIHEILRIDVSLKTNDNIDILIPIHINDKMTIDDVHRILVTTLKNDINVKDKNNYEDAVLLYFFPETRIKIPIIHISTLLAYAQEQRNEGFPLSLTSNERSLISFEKLNQEEKTKIDFNQLQEIPKLKRKNRSIGNRNEIIHELYERQIISFEDSLELKDHLNNGDISLHECFENYNVDDLMENIHHALEEAKVSRKKLVINKDINDSFIKHTQSSTLNMEQIDICEYVERLSFTDDTLHNQDAHKSTKNMTKRLNKIGTDFNHCHEIYAAKDNDILMPEPIETLSLFPDENNNPTSSSLITDKSPTKFAIERPSLTIASAEISSSLNPVVQAIYHSDVDITEVPVVLYPTNSEIHNSTELVDIENNCGDAWGLIKDDFTNGRRQNGNFYSLYQLEEILGSGTSSRVYIAKRKEGNSQFRTGSRKAVKVISKDHIIRPEYVQREIEILCSVQHKHIVDLSEIYENDDDIFLVMELCHMDLLQLIHKEGVITEKLAKLLVKNLLSATSYLHGQGIVHRDIKPENILISLDEKLNNSDISDIRLTDFGIARKLDNGGLSYSPLKLSGVARSLQLKAMSNKQQCEDEEFNSLASELTSNLPRLSRTHTKCGTRDYIAPEVLNGEGYGIQADMWSIGIVCYSILIGYSPIFLPDKNGSRRISFINDSNEKISPEAKDMIEKLLIHDQEKRMTAVEALYHPWINS